MTPPDGLTEKFEMFRSNGRIFREHDDLFTETSWLAVLVGQGLKAGGYHPAADLLSDAETLQRVANIRRVVADTAEQLPTQREFLRMNGSTSDISIRRAS
jgi:tryptophan halogenase